MRSWVEAYEKLVELLGDLSDDALRKLDKNEEFNRLSEELKARFVREVVGVEVRRAKLWLRKLNEAADNVAALLGVKGLSLPREFASFTRDPEAHLRKKLFNYVFDLLRGKLSLEEFSSKARAAVKTSLLTNKRSVYQTWVYVSIIVLLAKRGYRLVYPSDGYLHVERTGKQRTGKIPPNAVMARDLEALSFFIEAPRPIGWEDTSDLSRAWNLYIALRPDMLIYGGRVLNIVDFSNPETPILRPDIILECKELDDWYMRARELKGPLVKPLTAEEWKVRWLEGLWDGLADILGVEREAAVDVARKRRGLRLKDQEIVALYAKFYNPKEAILVTRARTPGDVKRALREMGVEVFDDISFNPRRLEPVVDILETFSVPEEVRADFVELTPAALGALNAIMRELLERGLAASPQRIVEAALKAASRDPDKVVAELEDKRTR